MTTAAVAATATVQQPVTGAPVKEKKVVETSEFIKFMRRMVRATGRRVADRDIEALAGLQMLRDELDAEIQRSVDMLRTPEGGGYSYSDVARVLGTSRQAAQQRFGKK